MTSSLTRLLPVAHSTGPSLSRRLADLAALRRSRRALAALDADRLADIGVSADRARKEALRQVWDVPKNWTR